MSRTPFAILISIILEALTLSGCSTGAGSSDVAPRPPSLQGKGEPDDDLGVVADFAFTQASGQTVRRQDLQGKVWVASFLFTRCCTGCPRISSDLLQLQKDLANTEDVLIVSFTVDPEHDTPSVLKAYADSLGADSKRWLFLTGKQPEIYRLTRDSFHLGVEQNQGESRKPGNEVTHSNRLIVVDRQGHIRGWDFDGTKAEDLPRLRKRIDELLQEKP
jgi:cytochrome oxidase Cu insertion factor (SCO1/SenC/PrrC family)